MTSHATAYNFSALLRSIEPHAPAAPRCCPLLQLPPLQHRHACACARVAAPSTFNMCEHVSDVVTMRGEKESYVIGGDGASVRAGWVWRARSMSARTVLGARAVLVIYIYIYIYMLEMRIEDLKKNNLRRISSIAKP
jgi:hypothetical protein